MFQFIMRFYLLLFLGCYYQTNVYAQKLTSYFYSTTKGIPQSQVLSLVEDTKLGYLWVGTNGGGAAQFDGKKFTTYTIEDGIIDNTIFKIVIDIRNHVWFATPRGISKFDGISFKNFFLPEPSFLDFVELGDTIIASTRNLGIVKIHADAIINQSKHQVDFDVSRIIIINKSESYWLVGTKLFGKDQTGVISTIDLSHLGKVYDLLTIANRVYLVTESGTFSLINSQLILVDSRINFDVLFANGDFSIVWANRDNNLIEIRRNSILRQDTILRGVRTFVGMEDSEHNYWFGTDGKGLLKRNFLDFEKVDDQITFSVFEDEHNLWVGTNELRVLKEGKHIKNYVIKNKFGQSFVTALKKDSEGNMWALGGFNLARIDGKTGQVRMFSKTGGLLSDAINDIEIDRDDNVWLCYGLGTRLGVGVIKKLAHTDFEFNKNLSSPVVISAKYISYGNRILFLTKNGVDQLYDNELTKLKLPKFDQTSIYCAAPYKKNMVVIGSVGRGLCVYNFDTDSAKYVSKAEGLISGLIYSLQVDEIGYVWIGSNKGIERILFDDQLKIKEYLFFSEDSGLEDPETNFNASYFYGKNKYFGLVDGLYRYTNVNNKALPNYPLHITEIDLLNSESLISEYENVGKGMGLSNHVEAILPWHQNSIRFSFAKVSKKYPNSAEYKAMLVGLEQHWTPQPDQEVVYRNLPEGHYSLNVLAREMDGKWMKKPLVYSFEVLPPFYRTASFVVLSLIVFIITIGIVIYLIAKMKIKKTLQIEQIKQLERIQLRREIGRDFHDEIGNQLARIVRGISLIRISPMKREELLTKIEESAQSLIGGTNDFVWALDHSNDSADQLFIHLKDFGDRLFSEKGIEFRAYYQLEQPFHLPIGHARQMNLIIKEGLTNIFKHSKATKVNLSFCKLLFNLTIILEDNGAGLSEANIDSSTGGLRNMKVRANRIQAKLVILPVLSGTQIKLIIEPK